MGDIPGEDTDAIKNWQVFVNAVPNSVIGVNSPYCRLSRTYTADFEQLIEDAKQGVEEATELLRMFTTWRLTGCDVADL